MPGHLLVLSVCRRVFGGFRSLDEPRKSLVPWRLRQMGESMSLPQACFIMSHASWPGI